MPVDSHCHLNYPGLVEDQTGAIARARAAGVSAMLAISTRSAEWDDVIRIAEAAPDIWASVGVHPHEADNEDIEMVRLVEITQHPRVIGIGETGLDYYYDKSDRDRQRGSFRRHIAAARETGLPVIVHAREAEADTLEIMGDELGKGAYPAVIHCFTASADFGRKALEMGFYISLSGIVTFKNAADLAQFATEIPEDRLLVETDAPFLAPVPKRGKTCEPAFVTHTAAFVAEKRGVSYEDLDRTTTENFYRLFLEGAAMKVTILGSGTSSGVPRIGNDWGLCDPKEPKNRRRRVSVLVEADGHAILMDTSPDLREQLLSAGVSRIDAVLFSHDHADHIHGIDDLRQVFHIMRKPVDCYAVPETWRVLKTRFDYIFTGGLGYPPSCIAHNFPASLRVGPMTVTPFEQVHGPIRSTGFRVDHAGHSMAYSTDISDLTLSADNAVKGVDLWIVDALRRKPHPTHSHLDRTLSWISRLRPRRAILTHMDNSMDYATLSKQLPAGVEPGYDMLTVEL